MTTSRPAPLLVSLHDVSPLTLSECEAAVELLSHCGLSPAELTILVIPHHEGQIALDAHPATVGFLRRLEDEGARLVMHGLTHRMAGRAWTPLGLFRAHVFARGQGELYAADARETRRRLDEGRAILLRAGLAGAVRAFVPPAWLLSPAGRRVVAEQGFEFYELFGGIVHQGRRHARRVVGWGSLSSLETAATAIYADLQSLRTSVDTRLAIHPADMRRPSQVRAVRRTLLRLLRGMRPLNYTTFLREKIAHLAAAPARP
jgi:predicted deacetylase